MMRTFTHFQEIGVEISVHVGLAATDREDNCRGEYLDYEDAEGVVAGLLVETLTELLGWQQLGSDQPKKMVLCGDHLGCVALRRHLMLRWADR